MNYIPSVARLTSHGRSKVVPQAGQQRGKSNVNIDKLASRHAVSAAAVAAFVLLAGNPLLVHACTGGGNITLTGSRSSFCDLVANTSLTIAPSGVISRPSSGIVVQYLRSGVSILNQGTIEARFEGVYNAGQITQLTNSGSITVWPSTVAGYYAIVNYGEIGFLTNMAGGIIGNASSSYGIYTFGANTTITNEAGGSIGGNRAAVYARYEPMTLNNAGAIIGNVDAELTTLNLLGTQASITGTVVNTGGSVNVRNSADFTPQNTFNSSTFLIESGGTLRVSGTAYALTVLSTDGDAFRNSGTLDVAEGLMANVQGNYTQSGTLRIGASSTSSYGRLAVNGNATLTNAARFEVDVNGSNTLAVGQTLTDVLTAATLSNSAPAHNVTDNSYLFDFESVTHGNAVDLAIVAAAAPPAPGPTPVGIVSAVLQNSLRSGAPAAGVLDGFIRGGATGNDFDNVVTSLGQLPDSRSVALAVGQTMPSLHGNAPATLMHLAANTGVVIQQQLQATPLTSLLERYLAVGGRAVGGRAGGANPPGQRLWVKTLGNRVEQDAVGGASGYKLTTDGLMVGTQTDLNETTTLGFGLGYLTSNVDGQDFAASHSSDIESVQLVSYGRVTLDSTGWKMNWQGDFTRSHVESERNISFMGRIAQADYDGVALHLGVGISKAYQLNLQTTVRPMVALDWRRFKAEGYTETGAGALNLQVDEQTAHEAILKVGAQVQQQFTPKTQWLASAALGYDLRNQRNAVTARFTGGGVAFTTEGLPASRALAELGMGVLYKANDNLDVVAQYDLRLRKGLRDQTASVRLNWAF
ncbi:autotransporter family protein [Hydrogenophaga sp.]|uniref:autotransporter family protein n=1 Tax=Hydrogenophaga sp. TaxID=1904254 RepID=UPI002FCCB114